MRVFREFRGIGGSARGRKALNVEIPFGLTLGSQSLEGGGEYVLDDLPLFYWYGFDEGRPRGLP